MGRLENTKTVENLAKAFAGESQARNRYDFFSNVAKKEGYVHISNIFNETAINEKAHAKVFYKYIIEGLDIGESAIPVLVDTEYGFGYSTTLNNLKYAGEGEEEETIEYPKFAQIAKEEGFHDIAASFLNITEVEKAHRNRYFSLYRQLKNDMIFKADESVYWKCINCGYIFEGTTAPPNCPACKHPQGFFERLYELDSEIHVANEK